ncbi:hypothetical protein LX86_004495 [Lentzea aerocolonigenes]|nr:hypothetical protein [Lentzea aerocolonigenes]
MFKPGDAAFVVVDLLRGVDRPQGGGDNICDGFLNFFKVSLSCHPALHLCEIFYYVVDAPIYVLHCP